MGKSLNMNYVNCALLVVVLVLVVVCCFKPGKEGFRRSHRIGSGWRLERQRRIKAAAAAAAAAECDKKRKCINWSQVLELSPGKAYIHGQNNMKDIRSHLNPGKCKCPQDGLPLLTSKSFWGNP